jgi:hypothetical protein
LKFIRVSIGTLILAFFVLGAGTVSAACNDGTPSNDTLDCNSNPPDGVFGGGLGNDTMTVSGTTNGLVAGDSPASGVGSGQGGNDTIIVNAGVTSGSVMGDYILGNGGHDTIIINGTVTGSVIGDQASDDSGNDTIIINGTVNNSVYGDSTLGHIVPGSDTIIIRGTVNGGIYADDASIEGDDTVIIHFGATVGGPIRGQGGFDTLQFQGTGASDAELATANALAASCNAVGNCFGNLTFAGKSYTFDTFEKLIILLQQIEAGIVPDSGTSAPSAPGEICTGAVKVFRMPNGDLEAYSGFDVLAPNGFLVGVIPAGTVPSGQSFSDPNAPLAGWAAVFNADGTIIVTTSEGSVVNSGCRV